MAESKKSLNTTKQQNPKDDLLGHKISPSGRSLLEETVFCSLTEGRGGGGRDALQGGRFRAWGHNQEGHNLAPLLASGDGLRGSRACVGSLEPWVLVGSAAERHAKPGLQCLGVPA